MSNKLMRQVLQDDGASFLPSLAEVGLFIFGVKVILAVLVFHATGSRNRVVNRSGGTGVDDHPQSRNSRGFPSYLRGVSLLALVYLTIVPSAVSSCILGISLPWQEQHRVLCCISVRHGASHAVNARPDGLLLLQDICPHTPSFVSTPNI